MYQAEIINNGIRTVIHNPLPGKKAAKLLSGSIKREVNAIPSFTFEMGANNPGLRMMHPYLTRVEVRNLQTGKLVFEGRVLMPTPSMSDSGEIRKKIVCEGVKAYLYDSVQPYLLEKHWQGDGKRTGLEEFIDYILGRHNGQVEEYKRIYRGTVNVRPFESSNSVTKGLNYQNTYECIKEKLVDSFGGEFDVRRGEDGLLYLDYVEEFGNLKGTEIALGVNMQSISQESDPTEMVTRLIPLGAKKKDGGTESEERLTIESVNDGKNYVIDKEVEAVYGIHYATAQFDDVTTAAALKSKGQQWLIANNRIKQKNSVTALELGLINKKYGMFELYNYYPVKNELIGVDVNARVISQTIDIISPEKSTLTFGDKLALLSDFNINQEKNTNDVMKRVETVQKNVAGMTKTIFSVTAPDDTNALWIDTSQNPPMAKKYDSTSESWMTVNDVAEIIQSVRGELSSVVNQLPDKIESTVGSKTYLKNEVDVLLNELKTVIEQLDNAVSIKISQVDGKVTEIEDNIDTTLEGYMTYFDFQADGMHIGTTKSIIELKLSNDRLAFMEGTTEVAYIGNRKLYITNAEVTESLTIGNFGFTKESNGSLTFGKIR